MTDYHNGYVHWRRGIETACGAAHKRAETLKTCCRLDPVEATCWDCFVRWQQEQAQAERLRTFAELKKLNSQIRAGRRAAR